jgi:hypothetical protein
MYSLYCTINNNLASNIRKKIIFTPFNNQLAT